MIDFALSARNEARIALLNGARHAFLSPCAVRLRAPRAPARRCNAVTIARFYF
jgi:hypothetical protein